MATVAIPRAPATKTCSGVVNSLGKSNNGGGKVRATGTGEGRLTEPSQSRSKPWRSNLILLAHVTTSDPDSDTATPSPTAIVNLVAVQSLLIVTTSSSSTASSLRPWDHGSPRTRRRDHRWIVVSNNLFAGTRNLNTEMSR
ncbi:pyrophosphate-energized vacuolar membrane protonpump [Striga asiatica]|uniref:Pyrophosphate-energized vacuolar membrane protonpump n=1 Tax=Striga asiatica TaxID=4170 RepID=A0A5A7R0N5_STRAF|nr:pyrophosphate-energized vacuolar membrane protonpump [Striga asiatica]